MKVLLVTDQYVDVRSDGCYCNYALLGTLRNMSTIGELYVAAAKMSQRKPAAQPVNQAIDFIDKENVKHLKPLTSSIWEYWSNIAYNKKILAKMIPQVDLVIGYTPGHNLDFAFRIARRNKIPYMTFLVACPWDGMRNHQRWIVRMLAPVYFYKVRKIIQKSDYVHYVTNSFLQERYPTDGKSLGCSDTNLRHIDPLALSERFEKFASKSLSDEIKLFTIGHTDIRYKGQEYVIKAIASLIRKGENRYHYYMIGAGDGIYLRQICKQMHVENNIHFLGRKTPEEVMALLKDADVYVQPSLQEGLPRAVVEAMSMALPCIGFNTGGIPELLEPSFIVKKKDVEGIVRCIESLNNFNLYQKTAKRNFELAKEYEHSVLTYRIQEYFKQIRSEIENNYNRNN